MDWIFSCTGEFPRYCDFFFFVEFGFGILDSGEVGF